MPESEPDVVIVGSGPGGGACAFGLAKAGIRVLVLEAGPRFNPFTDYRLLRPDWERNRFPKPAGSRGTYTFGELQPLESRWDGLRSWNRVSGRINQSDRRRGWKYSHIRGVGGSTLHFAGEAHRLHPRAMKLRTLFGVGADWPITYAQLEPHYNEAEVVVGVAGPMHDLTRPRNQPYPLPPHGVSYASGKLVAGFEALGLGWQQNSLAILSRPYDGRPNCNYCNNCARGCPRTDKGSVDVTFLRKAVASEKCTIRPDSTVVRIDAGGGDRVSGVDYFDKDGNLQKVTARVLVLACGAVETPRLLLNSANPYSPGGLANESGEVGRNFMETLAWISSGLHPHSLGSHRGVPSDVICWDFNAPDAIPGEIGGCRFSSSVAEADLLGPVNYAQRIVNGWGSEHKRRMRDVFGRVLTVGAIGESLPNDRTYVDLDPESTDGHGLPAARINAFLPSSDLARLEFMAEKCREILLASGATELVEEYGAYDFFNATHVFGTCRMGNDPETSVVDERCRAHRWRNLYVCDASVFPSSGGGESPSLTIEAVALHAAAGIRDRLARREL